MATARNIELKAQCHCRRQTFTAPVSTDALPFETGICHCTSCRHLTGGLFSCIIPWLGSHSAIWASSLKRYSFSERVTLFFCGTCSSAMFFHFANGTKDEVRDEHGYIEVNVAMLPNFPDINLIRVRDHLFVGDTLDGGASVMMRAPNADGCLVPLWKGARGQEQLSSAWPTQKDLTKGVAQHEIDEVPISCHCGGVQYVLQTGAKEYNSMDPASLPSFVDPQTCKFIAKLDACDSCRLTCGTQPTCWIKSPMKNIHFIGQGKGDEASLPAFPHSFAELKEVVSSSTSATRHPQLGKLGIYNSSANAARYFCSNCSALIFYTRQRLPNIVDIPVGILNSQVGARAEDVVRWNVGSIGYMEDVMGGWRQKFMEPILTNCETMNSKVVDG